jgi:hypothetical protein
MYPGLLPIKGGSGTGREKVEEMGRGKENGKDVSETETGKRKMGKGKEEGKMT